MKTSLPPVDAMELTDSASPLGGVARFLAAWDRFWFRPADPTVLGFIRVCTGTIVVFVHLCYCYDLMGFVNPERAWLDDTTAHYLRKSYDVKTFGYEWNEPAQSVGDGLFNWSIYFHLRDERAIWAAHFVILSVMLLFTLGVCTRLTSVLTWVGVLCYVQRMPTQMFGMDTMMVILVTYLMIGPSGGALSLDRVWYLWRERRRRGQPNWTAPPEASVSANIALRLIQVHFCVIYLAAGTSKLLGPAWWNGTALWLCLANYSFAPMEFAVYMSFLKLLVESRFLWELALTGGVVFTLIMEIGFPFLVWNRSWRWLMVTGAMLLHFGIGLTMGLASFSLLMMLMAFSFAPPEAVRWLLSGLGRLVRPAAAAPAAAAVKSDALALSR
jgi:hypothetical protein